MKKNMYFIVFGILIILIAALTHLISRKVILKNDTHTFEPLESNSGISFFLDQVLRKIQLEESLYQFKSSNAKIMADNRINLLCYNDKSLQTNRKVVKNRLEKVTDKNYKFYYSKKESPRVLALPKSDNVEDQDRLFLFRLLMTDEGLRLKEPYVMTFPRGKLLNDDGTLRNFSNDTLEKVDYIDREYVRVDSKCEKSGHITIQKSNAESLVEVFINGHSLSKIFGKSSYESFSTPFGFKIGVNKVRIDIPKKLNKPAKFIFHNHWFNPPPYLLEVELKEEGSHKFEFSWTEPKKYGE